MADSTLGFQFDACSRDLTCAPEARSADARSADARLTESREDDRLLVAQLRTGVESAYELLLERFERPVFNMVSRLLDDPSDAADVAQEVFLKIFRNIGSFRGDSSLKTWIYRIAVNEARNQRRWFSRHRRQEVGLEADPGEARGCQDWLADPGRSPFESALDRETEALIERALAEVNPTFRAALVLREIEGLSYEDIADILEISLGTVKSRILRGRDALRKQLAGRFEPAAAVEWSPRLAAD